MNRRLGRDRLLCRDEQPADFVELVGPRAPSGSGPGAVDRPEVEDGAPLGVRMWIQVAELVTTRAAVVRDQPAKRGQHRLGEHLRPFDLARLVEEVERILHISV